MAIGGFADNAVVANDFAEGWTHKRFFIKPRGGPGVNRSFQLAGVWEISGRGVTVEGQTLVYAADGTGCAYKITEGREAPNEITTKLDPGTFTNIIRQYIIIGKGRNKVKYAFDFVVQTVDPAGLATKSESSFLCRHSGHDFEDPADGNPSAVPFKFKPTFID